MSSQFLSTINIPHFLQKVAIFSVVIDFALCETPILASTTVGEVNTYTYNDELVNNTINSVNIVMEQGPLALFTHTTTELLLSSIGSGDMSALYQIAVGALTGAAMTRGVVAAGAVYLLAWLVGSIYSTLITLGQVMGMSPENLSYLVKPILGRGLTQDDLDMVERILVDAIDVYGAWAKSIDNKWRGEIVDKP